VLDSDLLRGFVSVVDAGSFTRADERVPVGVERERQV
jgi:hypothetical protein